MSSRKHLERPKLLDSLPSVIAKKKKKERKDYSVESGQVCKPG